METKKQKLVHTLPGAQKAMQPLTPPTMQPQIPQMPMAHPQVPGARPFGLIHNYLSPKPPPIVPTPKLPKDEE